MPRARPARTGGTVIAARRRGRGSGQALFRHRDPAEREIVFLIVRSEQRQEVMAALDPRGRHEDAQLRNSCCRCRCRRRSVWRTEPSAGAGNALCVHHGAPHKDIVVPRLLCKGRILSTAIHSARTEYPQIFAQPGGCPQFPVPSVHRLKKIISEESTRKKTFLQHIHQKGYGLLTLPAIRGRIYSTGTRYGAWIKITLRNFVIAARRFLCERGDFSP